MNTNLIIGQDIAYCTSRQYFSSAFIKFDRVKSISKTGVVTLEGGRKFNKYGSELKSAQVSFPSSDLVEIEVAEKRLATERSRKESAQKIQELQKVLHTNNTGILSTDQIAAIDALIASF